MHLLAINIFSQELLTLFKPQVLRRLVQKLMNQVEMERLRSHGSCEKNKQVEYSMRNGHVIPQCIGGLAAQVPHEDHVSCVSSNIVSDTITHFQKGDFKKR